MMTILTCCSTASFTQGLKGWIVLLVDRLCDVLRSLGDLLLIEKFSESVIVQVSRLR